jgi:FAD/FMN-containing dehydrogenase
MFKSSFLLQAFLCISTIFGSASAGLLPRTQAQQDDSECRCFPGDSCWPTPSEWSAFNETIGGRLIATIPIASVCHHDSFAAYDEAACAQLQTDWLLPETHYSSSSSIMAQFFANASCDPFSPPSAQCVIGTYVQYAVNATGQDDYQKTMAFASERNIRFVVRNTGHDYLGKSTGAGALALWTHHLTDTEFLNYRSSSYTGKAMKMGAGVQSLDALTAAHAEGLVVAVGQCQTVGVAGGYTQGGGHSFLASSVGLSADQVLEWEVVTATGQYLIATPTENSDLYWALSGGGGGTYAAVLSATVKAYPDLQVAGANLTFEQTATVSNAQFYGAVKLWLAGLPLVVDAGGVVVWGMAEGFFTLTPLLAPGLTKLELEILLAPLLAYLSLNKIPYSTVSYPYDAMIP